MICKECGREIDDKVEFCYYCGADTINSTNTDYENIDLLQGRPNGKESSVADTVNNFMGLVSGEIGEGNKSGSNVTYGELEPVHDANIYSDITFDDSSKSVMSVKACRVCGGRIKKGKILADNGTDIFDLFADGTFCADDDEQSINGGGIRIHLSGPEYYCPSCQIVTGFFNV